MNAPRPDSDDYLTYLMATAGPGTATEIARCQPHSTNAPAHDAFTRLLNR